MVIGSAILGDRVRLHITPFDKDLLGKLLPVSLQSQATDISFHSIQTFPERRYGYVELPATEAQKLRKKFNGTTLKGSKIRVEEAKAMKRRVSEQAEKAEDQQATKRRKKERRKSEFGVLPGHEMDEGRIVKRGWTGDANTKKGYKGKGSGNESSLKDRKLRFRTAVPPDGTTIRTDSRDKTKRDREGSAKRTGGKMIVTEFQKTSKLHARHPSSTSRVGSVIYEEGRGWLDENGELVEAEHHSRRRQRQHASAQATPISSITPDPDAAVETDLDARTDSGPPSDDALLTASLSSGATSETALPSDSEDSGDTTSSSSEDEISSNASTDSSEGITPLTTYGETPSTVRDVHPLEALYKRPAVSPDGGRSNRKPAPIDTSFSFFGQDQVNQRETDEDGRHLPQTPHTSKDLEWRSIRSAAPTPDTALPGKRFNFALTDDDSEDQDEVDVDADSRAIRETGLPANFDRDEAGVAIVARGPDEEEAESEFRKWFYDNRGDLNRGWKRRRREEKKLHRQRENRRLGRRVA